MAEDNKNSIYKYVSYKIQDNGINYDKENIKNDKIWFSNALNLNDPFEGSFYDSSFTLGEQHQRIIDDLKKMLSFSENEINKVIDLIKKNKPNSNREAKELFEDMLNKFIDLNSKKDNLSPQELIDEIEQMVTDFLLKQRFDIFRKDFYISCFTKNLINIPMWAHYANNHKGVCIEYDLKDLEKSTDIRCVEYKDNMLILNDFNKKLKKHQEIIENISRNNLNQLGESMNYFMQPFLIKHKDWGYEMEYRSFYKNQNNNISSNKEGEERPAPRIKAIYLGLNFYQMEDAEQEEKDLIEISKQKGINGFSIYKMEQSKTEYKLIQRKIYSPK